MVIRLLIFAFLLGSCSAPPKQASEDPKVKENRDAIRKTMMSHRKYIGNCYGRTLTKKGNENLKGTVMVKFKIGPDGRAQNAAVVPEKSSLKSGMLNDCLLAGVRSWDFPVVSGGDEINVSYPFVFRANPPANMQQKLDQFEMLKKTR